ncbi:YveK family protein [Paenibacillus sp. CMAA1364]
MELKLLMNMIRKRLWLMVSFILLCTLSTGYYSLYHITPMYEATSTVIVNKENQNGEGKSALDMNVISSNIMLINSYKEIVKSATIMDKVVQKNPEFKVSSKDLMERLKVTTTQNSQIITLTIKDTSYNRAMNIVNAISQNLKSEIPIIMKVDNISILDVAQPQLVAEPVSPNIILNIVIALVVSFMIAIGFVLVKEYLNDTVENEEDVERYLGLTTLGTIQPMKIKNMKIRTKRKSKEKIGEHYASIS